MKSILEVLYGESSNGVPVDYGPDSRSLHMPVVSLQICPGTIVPIAYAVNVCPYLKGALLKNK